MMNNQKVSTLLQGIFDPVRLRGVIDHSELKGINKTVLRKWCDPKNQVGIYYLILTGNYHVAPPHEVLIPKDKPGEFRICKANEDDDRVLMTLINDTLNDLFSDMIHPTSKAYQKGTGTCQISEEAMEEIASVNLYKKGYKTDYSKFFDTITINWIDWAFDIIEERLGFEHGTEPVVNLLRECYHNDWLFDINGNLIEKYTSIRQGNAVAAFLANVIIYDIDEKMSQMCNYYVRYSDDSLLIGKNADKAIELLKSMIVKYGVSLNPNKVKAIYEDAWFTFLGFSIKGNLITLSPNRIKKFQKEIFKRSIDKPNITAVQARKSIQKFLYEGEYNFATASFSIINCKPDIEEMNKLIMDCLRACEVRDMERKKGKKTYKISHSKIGGLGVVNNLLDRTIVRGVGKNVTRNRNKTKKEIDGYVAMTCLVKNYQQKKSLFKAVVRGIR